MNFHGYTSQRGKARWAKPVRRLETNGSPTIPRRYSPKTRQAQSVLGVAMAGRLHKTGWNDRQEANYLENRRNHLLPAFGKTRLCDIGTLEIQQFVLAK